VDRGVDTGLIHSKVKTAELIHGTFRRHRNHFGNGENVGAVFRVSGGLRRVLWTRLFPRTKCHRFDDAGCDRLVRYNQCTSPNSSADQAALYKPVDQKQTDATLATKESQDTGGSTATENSTPSSASDPIVPPPLYAYYVQVAAVSKQGDAEALVSALKNKQYQAFSASNSPTDKFIHVQVGPFADIKDAEATRSKLISDGYNPILKK